MVTKDLEAALINVKFQDPGPGVTIARTTPRLLLLSGSVQQHQQRTAYGCGKLWT